MQLSYASKKPNLFSLLILFIILEFRNGLPRIPASRAQGMPSPNGLSANRSPCRCTRPAVGPGVAFSAIVPGDQVKAGFNAIVLDILGRHGGKTDWGDKPGSIRSLVNPVRLEAVLRNAGFTEVRVSSMPTVQKLESASETTAMIREGFAFFTALIADLSKKGRMRPGPRWNWR